MTDDATPREVGSHAGLGPAPERDLVERLRSRRNFMSTDAVRWYMTATPDGDCEEAAAEIERLRAENAALRTMLTRYRLEVPLGNQPPMLAHAVDVALGRA